MIDSTRTWTSTLHEFYENDLRLRLRIEIERTISVQLREAFASSVMR